LPTDPLSLAGGGLVVGSVRHNLISRKQKAYSESRKELISSKQMTADLSLSMARISELSGWPSRKQVSESDEQHLGEYQSGTL
jgi:hypothetical protein